MGRKSLRSAAFRGRVPVGEINRFFAILQPGFSATRRSICSFADAVVPRRAMQAGVEVEVGFVGRVRPGAKDGSEVAAGSHAESVDEVARCPLILLLHKDAAVVGQKKAANVDRLSLGVFARDRARLVVAGLASEGFSCFDPGEPLASITEGERRSDLPHPAPELLRKTAQHGGLAGQADYDARRK
jgi:hypothetical protein